MSKATFPNTTRRRLASSVVCRLSSSGAAFVFLCFCYQRPVTPHGQETSQARSLQLLFTAHDRADGLLGVRNRITRPLFCCSRRCLAIGTIPFLASGQIRIHKCDILQMATSALSLVACQPVPAPFAHPLCLCVGLPSETLRGKRCLSCNA